MFLHFCVFCFGRQPLAPSSDAYAAGTKGTLKPQLPPLFDDDSTRNENKIIPDLLLIETDPRSNGAECVLDGAYHVLDFKTLQGLSHNEKFSLPPQERHLRRGKQK